MHKYFILISLFIFSSCSTRISGTYNFPMEIKTYDEHQVELEAKCSLYSSETRMKFKTPRTINYLANCGPINIICKVGALSGEFGVIPKKEEELDKNTILSTGAGIIFDRLVDATTPFGMFIRYSNAFDDSVCLIPKKINVQLE